MKKLHHYWNANADKYFCGKSKKVASQVQDYVTTDIDSVDCNKCLNAYISDKGVK